MIYIITGINEENKWILEGRPYIEWDSFSEKNDQELSYTLITKDRRVHKNDKIKSIDWYSILDLLSINAKDYLRKVKGQIKNWQSIPLDLLVLCNDEEIIDDIYKSFFKNSSTPIGVDELKPQVVIINVFIANNVFKKFSGDWFVNNSWEKIYINNFDDTIDSQKVAQEEFNYQLSLIMGQYNLRIPQTLTITKADTLFEILDKWFIFSKDRKMKFAFRGQSSENEYYCGLVRNVDKIIDSMSISINSNEEIINIYKSLEEEALKRFEENASLYFTNMSDMTDFISMAQHFGIATRMLDWTFNPYAAILFSMYINDNPEGDYYTLLAIDCHDQIYCNDLDLNNLISTEEFRNEYTSRFHNEFLFLCNKVTEVYQCLKQGEEKDALTIIDAIFKKSIAVAAQREQNYEKNHTKANWDIQRELQNRLNDKFLQDKMFLVLPSFSNQRIATQQGILQLVNNFDKKEHIAQIRNNCITIKIHKNLKEQIIQSIEKMGHNMYKLMPDIQNSCRIIMKKCNDTLRKSKLKNMLSKNTKVKVLFMYPEYEDISHYGAKIRKEIPPFGVLYLATAARNVGADVKVKPIRKEMPKEAYNLKGYDIVAFSIPSSVTYSFIKDFISKAEFDNKTWKIVGGLHATLFPKQMLKELNVDVVSVDEGEKTIQDIIHVFPNRKWSDIQGILFCENENIRETNKREKEKNLDALGFPARDLLSIEDVVMNRLSDTNYKMAHIMCSRGCPNDCAFCCNLDRRIRYRSGKHIRQELEELVRTYGIEGFCIIDDNFLINNKEVLDIIDNIKGLNLKWSALSRINNVNKDLLEKAKEAGCIEIKYGVESGSQTILDKMNKKITIDQIKKAITATNELGIKTKVFIMHGFPGENNETTQETINLLEELKDKINRISLFRFTPLPGSDVYDHHEKYGICLPENFDDIFIYNNSRKWWGSDADKEIVDKSYELLSKYIIKTWGNY